MIRPLYKAEAPFMESESGHGYKGVIMYDEREDKVQCHVCGEWFSALGAHVKAHGSSADDYRQDHGLNFNIALCGKSVAKMRREKCTVQFVKAKGARPRPKKRKSPVRQVGTRVISQQNKFGLCELQMRGRYAVVSKIVGGQPTTQELRKHDHALLSAIERRFKTLNAYRVSLGEKPKKISDYHLMEDVTIIASLRARAHELKCTLRPKHFSSARGGSPHYSTIVKHFGAWKTALQQAGLSYGYGSRDVA